MNRWSMLFHLFNRMVKEETIDNIFNATLCDSDDYTARMCEVIMKNHSEYFNCTDDVYRTAIYVGLQYLLYSNSDDHKYLLERDFDKLIQQWIEEAQQETFFLN